MPEESAHATPVPTAIHSHGSTWRYWYREQAMRNDPVSPCRNRYSALHGSFRRTGPDRPAVFKGERINMEGDRRLERKNDQPIQAGDFLRRSYEDHQAPLKETDGSLHQQRLSDSPESFVLDRHLLRPYSNELAQEEPRKPPYVVHFWDTINGSEKHLYVVAARHRDNDGFMRPTLYTIRRVMNEVDPQCLIYEGTKEIPSRSIERLGEESERERLKSREAEYALYLAKEKDIPCINGEPSMMEHIAELKKFDYTSEDLVAKDLAAWDLLHNVPRWREEWDLLHNVPRWGEDREKYEPMPPEVFDRHARYYLDHLYANQLKDIPENERFLFFGDVRKWCHTYLDRPGRSYLHLTGNDFAPIHGATDHFGRLLVLNDEIRENTIIQRIDQALEQHDRVVQVYGWGHLVKERKVFEHAFRHQETSKFS